MPRRETSLVVRRQNSVGRALAFDPAAWVERRAGRFGTGRLGVVGGSPGQRTGERRQADFVGSRRSMRFAREVELCRPLACPTLSRDGSIDGRASSAARP
jgi:hypothetical protein